MTFFYNAIHFDKISAICFVEMGDLHVGPTRVIPGIELSPNTLCLAFQRDPANQGDVAVASVMDLARSTAIEVRGEPEKTELVTSDYLEQTENNTPMKIFDADFAWKHAKYNVMRESWLSKRKLDCNDPKKLDRKICANALRRTAEELYAVSGANMRQKTITVRPDNDYTYNLAILRQVTSDSLNGTILSNSATRVLDAISTVFNFNRSYGQIDTLARHFRSSVVQYYADQYPYLDDANRAEYANDANNTILKPIEDDAMLVGQFLVNPVDVVHIDLARILIIPDDNILERILQGDGITDEIRDASRGYWADMKDAIQEFTDLYKVLFGYFVQFSSSEYIKGIGESILNVTKEKGGRDKEIAEYFIIRCANTDGWNDRGFNPMVQTFIMSTETEVTTVPVIDSTSLLEKVCNRVCNPANIGVLGAMSVAPPFTFVHMQRRSNVSMFPIMPVERPGDSQYISNYLTSLYTYPENTAMDVLLNSLCSDNVAGVFWGLFISRVPAWADEVSIALSHALIAFMRADGNLENLQHFRDGTRDLDSQTAYAFQAYCDSIGSFLGKKIVQTFNEFDGFTFQAFVVALREYILMTTFKRHCVGIYSGSEPPKSTSQRKWQKVSQSMNATANFASSQELDAWRDGKDYPVNAGGMFLSVLLR